MSSVLTKTNLLNDAVIITLLQPSLNKDAIVSSDKRSFSILLKRKEKTLPTNEQWQKMAHIIVELALPLFEPQVREIKIDFSKGILEVKKSDNFEIATTKQSLDVLSTIQSLYTKSLKPIFTELYASQITLEDEKTAIASAVKDLLKGTAIENTTLELMVRYLQKSYPLFSGQMIDFNNQNESSCKKSEEKSSSDEKPNISLFGTGPNGVHLEDFPASREKFIENKKYYGTLIIYKGHFVGLFALLETNKLYVINSLSENAKETFPFDLENAYMQIFKDPFSDIYDMPGDKDVLNLAPKILQNEEVLVNCGLHVLKAFETLICKGSQFIEEEILSEHRSEEMLLYRNQWIQIFQANQSHYLPRAPQLSENHFQISSSSSSSSSAALVQSSLATAPIAPAQTASSVSSKPKSEKGFFSSLLDFFTNGV